MHYVWLCSHPWNLVNLNPIFHERPVMTIFCTVSRPCLKRPWRLNPVGSLSRPVRTRGWQEQHVGLGEAKVHVASLGSFWKQKRTWQYLTDSNEMSKRSCPGLGEQGLNGLRTVSVQFWGSWKKPQVLSPTAWKFLRFCHKKCLCHKN